MGSAGKEGMCGRSRITRFSGTTGTLNKARGETPQLNVIRQRCLIRKTDATRRAEEATELFVKRYAIRSGIESANSGAKNRLGLGEPIESSIVVIPSANQCFQTQ